MEQNRDADAKVPSAEQGPAPDHDPEEGVRRSIFATHIAYGSAIPDALHAAGYTSTSLHLGWTLMSVPAVRDEIDQHRGYIRSKQDRSVKELIEQLDRDREFAIETRNAAVASACTIAQAKILGAMDAASQLKNGQRRLVLTWGTEEAIDVTPESVTEMADSLLVKTGSNDG